MVDTHIFTHIFVQQCYNDYVPELRAH